MPDGVAQAKWEYLVVDVHARHTDTLQEKLNEQGTQGWELVFMAEPVTCEYRCVFRKPA